MIHAVKTAPCYFEDAVSGKKPFEVRKNDRDYRERDYIALNEYDANMSETGYTGRSALFQITSILDNPEYCKEGYAVLGIKQFCIAENISDCSIIYGQARKF